MFFKRKMDVADYCTASLQALFSKDREKVWEQLRQTCNDPALSGVEKMLFFKHLRAIMIQLVLIAITKNFNMDISSDAHFFVTSYLENHGASQIDDIGRAYIQAFGATPHDGVAGMVATFSEQIADGRLRHDTMQRLHIEFYAVLKSLFDDFKSIKLTTK